MNNQELISDYYSLHRDEIVDFVAIRIQDMDEAQDIVQNLFLRLLSGHRLITEQTMPCLIYTMARHLVADYYRRRHVYEEYEHYIRRHDDSGDTVESVLSVRLIIERMEHSMARLSEECREVYRLHIYDGMRVSEISRQLHIPYKKAENQLGVARKTVRRYLCACV